jgi:hypothetical protein
MKKTVILTRRRLVAILAVVIAIFALAVTNSTRVSADGAEQIIFSGVGFASQGDWQGPVGFWIWCIDEGNGPYAEHNVCSGAMYVYSQAITVHVDGSVTENGDDTYTMTVSSRKPGVLDAVLHNLDAELNHGPSNLVEFDVTTAAGTAHGVSDSAVVNVTGPGD